jgi:hypothetical protein
VPPTSTPTAETVGRIVTVADPVIRNLQITECYAQLAVAMAERTHACANWCTFATWASKQAGATIRGEDVIDDLERELGQAGSLLHPIAWFWRILLRHGLLQPETAFGRWLAKLHTPYDAIQMAGTQVAEGNLKVFAEIGLAFADYLEQCPPNASSDSAALRRFLDGLRSGPPPDGQEYLKEAFRAYQAQRVETDQRVRSQLTALANLQIGLHEQTRLQPQILGALNSAVLGLERGFGFRIHERMVQRELTNLSRKVITRALMILTLPGAALSLAENISQPFPADLEEIVNAEFSALVSEYGTLPPAPDPCGATDWSILTQRMRYISHLFRAYHEDPALTEAPFTELEVASFDRGVIPEGKL